MSVVIVGGNHCMYRRYMELCEKFGCSAKVYVKERGCLKRKFGSPDLVILFTDTVSHRMTDSAVTEAKRCNAVVARCHNSSLNALQTILRSHCAGCEGGCGKAACGRAM